MLIRLLKIDWPVGFAAADEDAAAADAQRWRGRGRVFAFGALTAAVAIRQMELGGGKESEAGGRVVTGKWLGGRADGIGRMTTSRGKGALREDWP